VTTAESVNAIEALLGNNSLALLLTNSGSVGLNSGDRGLAIAVLGKTISNRPTAKTITDHY